MTLFVPYLFLVSFLATPHSLLDFSSPTRDLTHDPAVEVCSLNHLTTRKFPYLSLVTVIDLKPILSYITIVNFDIFWLSFVTNIFIYPFIFSLCMSLKLKGISHRHCMVGSCFLISSATLSFDSVQLLSRV